MLTTRHILLPFRRLPRWSLLACLLALAAIPLWAQHAPEPTHTDVAYGPDVRNKLDLWLADSDKPTPLVIQVHGGGFMQGDKNQFRTQGRTLAVLRQAGISVAAISYRLTDGGKNPFPIPMLDAARALQYLRYHAKEYNLDKTRVAMTGGSAGGCISLWLAFHPDLADPDNADPVLRESTRLTAVSVAAAQSSVYLPTLEKWFGVKSLREHPALRPLFAIPPDGPIEWTDQLRKTMQDASPITYLTADDPPVYLRYGQPQQVDENSNPGVWVHHAIMGIKLKEQMDALKIECHLDAGKAYHSDTYRNGIEFLIAKLTKVPKP